MKGYFAILLFFISSHLIADDCIREIPSPIVEEGHPAVMGYGILELENRVLTEKVALNDGVSLEIIHSGCAHYTLAYVFSIEQPFLRNKISQAKIYLNQVKQFAPTVTTFVSNQLSEIDDSHPTPSFIEFEPGYDGVRIDTETKNGKHTFTIVYDIAL